MLCDERNIQPDPWIESHLQRDEVARRSHHGALAILAT